MKQILERSKVDENKIVDLLSGIQNVMNPKFKNIHGCLIIDNEDALTEEKVNIQRILNMYGDKTGYEASCNEVRINDFLEDEGLTENELIQLGLIIADKWREKLGKSFQKNQYVFILVSNEGYVTLRFHMKRDEEKEWLNYDLEKYQEAVAVMYG